MAKFSKGRSGNPKGRPKGIVDRRSKYRALIDECMPDVINKVVSAALDGDMTACKILLDKMLPSVRSMAPAMCLPQAGKSTAQQSSTVVEAMLNGSLAPDQAATAMSVLVDHTRVCELADFEARLVTLERRNNAIRI